MGEVVQLVELESKENTFFNKTLEAVAVRNVTSITL